MTLGRFWEWSKRRYGSERQSTAEKPRRGWFEIIVGLIGIVAARASVPAYRAGGWHYLLACIALAVAAVVVLWFSWILWLLLLRPAVLFFVDEGIVGCWRWLRDKVLTPIAYGRKGK